MAKSARRVVFDIDPEVIARFDKRYSREERNKIVERMLVSVLETSVADVAAAAETIATDPAYREYDDVADWADAQAVDTLSRF